MVTLNDLRTAIKALRLSGRAVCIHSSMRSFEEAVEGGPDGIVDAFLQANCTVLVPAFSWIFSVPPPANDRPPRNAFDYTRSDEAWRALIAKRGLTAVHDLVFTPKAKDIDRDMGALSAAVVSRPDRARGNHPLNSFAAVGRIASLLVDQQQPLDVYAPLETLAATEGFVLLVGVDLRRMTLLHAAERRAGRKPFRRWARDANGEPIAVETGGCSRGFTNLGPTLAPLASQTRVGASTWTAFPAATTLEAAAAAIRRTPALTHCDDTHCDRCLDAVLGGPLV